MAKAHLDTASRDADKPRWFGPDARWFWPSVVACLVLQAALAVDCARSWTPTHDEFWHLPIGLRMWTSGKFDDDVINPPLVRMWAAIPLAFGGAQPGDAGAKPDVGDIGDAFWAANSDVRFWFLCGRLMIIPLATLTGLILALWGRAWCGERAAFLSVLLFSCCPTVIANAAIVTHDLPLATAWIATLFALVRFAERPSWRAALLFGAVLGIAQLTKLTALVLGPVCIVVWFVLRWPVVRGEGNASLTTPTRSVSEDARGIIAKSSVLIPSSSLTQRVGVASRTERRTLARQWLAALAVALLVINASYLFRGTGTALKDVPFASGRMVSVQRALAVVGGCPVPLPRDYIAAFDRLALDLERKHPVYLDGEWRDRPFARYYAAALSYKLPLSALVLILVASATLAWPRPDTLDRRRAVCLLFAAAILPVLASGSANQIGIRYVLPTLPLLHLFAGQAARWYLQPAGP